jgi:hypothetical protein
MKKIEIPLQKRTGKHMLYLAIGIFVFFILLSCIGNLFTSGFNWTATIFGGLMLFGAIAIGMSLSDYYKQKNTNLTVESDGSIVRFYILQNDGKKGESSKSIKLENMKRFYLVTKSTKYFIKDKSFEFEPKSGIIKTNIDVLPSLSDIDDVGVQKIMAFMNEVAPEVDLGYYGSTISQLFKK